MGGAHGPSLRHRYGILPQVRGRVQGDRRDHRGRRDPEDPDPPGHPIPSAGHRTRPDFNPDELRLTLPTAKKGALCPLPENVPPQGSTS